MKLTALKIKGTEFTPEIILDLDGNFVISGVSRPEDVSKFYEIPFKWLNQYKEEVLIVPGNKYKYTKVHVVFELKYFNSASAKHILKMLDAIKAYEALGLTLEVDWFYEEADEQLLEDGQDLSDAVEIPFNFIKMV